MRELGSKLSCILRSVLGKVGFDWSQSFLAPPSADIYRESERSLNSFLFIRLSDLLHSVMSLGATCRFVETEISQLPGGEIKSRTSILITWDEEGLIEPAQYSFGRSSPPCSAEIRSCGEFTLGFHVLISLDENILAARLAVLDLDDGVRWERIFNDLRQLSEDSHLLEGTIFTPVGHLSAFQYGKARVLLELVYRK